MKKKEEHLNPKTPKIKDLLNFRDLICSECIDVFNREGDIVPSYFIISWLDRKKEFSLNSYRFSIASFVRYGTKKLTYGNVIENAIRKQVQSLSTKREPIMGVVLAYRDYYLLDNNPKNLKKGSKIYCVCELSPTITENDNLPYRYEGISQILALSENSDTAGKFTWTENSKDINVKEFFSKRLKGDKK